MITLAPLNKYTPSMIACVIRNLGKSRVWPIYSQMFYDKKIDGSFIVECDIQKIESLGVRRPFARRIVHEFKMIKTMIEACS